MIECATNGTLKARYTHGPGMDEPLGLQKGTANYYYHADGLGSIVALTNTKGASAQLYRYDAFGRITQSGSVVQPYTYTAREYDTETGLYYYRARYYDPRAGRFITRDPIGFKGGINQYAYVANNPVNKVDPSGLFISGVGIGTEGMLLIGGGVTTNWCCDESNNLWRVRTKKVCFGLGAGYGAGGSLTIGNRRNCPNGYAGVTVEAAYGPISGDNSLGAEWGDIGIGRGPLIKIFVICINTFMEPPKKVGCCP